MTTANAATASWTGAAWNIESVGAININGGFLSLVLDSSGNPHIAYSSAQQIGYISGTNVQGTSWTNPQTVASVSGLAYFGSPSLALDPNGNPAISYFGYGPSQIKYAHWTGSAWAISSIVTLTGSPYAAWTSLAFDQAGTPHIAYEDMNGGLFGLRNTCLRLLDSNVDRQHRPDRNLPWL